MVSKSVAARKIKYGQKNNYRTENSLKMLDSKARIFYAFLIGISVSLHVVSIAVVSTPFQLRKVRSIATAFFVITFR